MNVKDSLASFQLIGSRVSQLNMSNDFLDLEEECKYSFDVKYDIGEIGERDNNLLGVITLIVTCFVTQDTNQEETADRELNLEIDIEGCFIAESEIGKEKFEELLTINGCACLYSIARSVVMDISSQSLHRGKITLPMVNFFQMHENQAKENESDEY